MTIKELLNLGINKLKKSDSTSPSLDAEVLLSFILKKPKEHLYTYSEKPVSTVDESRYFALLQDRSKSIPIAYLIGKKGFYEGEFIVNEHVLIPQPRTENLITAILEALNGRANLSILDLGTGSGAIIISVAKKLGPSNTYFASDISAEALKVAKRNAKNHGVSVEFKRGDLLKPWKRQFDVVIANLPYLEIMPTGEAKYEPRLALLGGKEGLELYHRLFAQLSENPPQYLFMEVDNAKQKAKLNKISELKLPQTKTIIIDK
ncbi:MAG TPA: peptide chain release factor N(5)-glutamine methyltransferase [Verrucomicrobiae bacterium]|nr:peptide chain release factor N(5)-glutamine methyltransferase [Verrucomicrobiae bacterium]